MRLEELINRIEELEDENSKLRERLKRNNKRKNIKTTKKEILNYWVNIQDECGLSVDWAEAHERCWRCGCKSNLQRCHIIPESLGGKDEPSNLVLLCTRCHIDALNVESPTFMWDWIRANGTPIYDTFWKIRAQKEYEFVYGKAFTEELMDRDILSVYDMRLFWNLEIGRSIHHFAHPWNNDSTDAGLLRMRLEEFDRKHKVIKKKSDLYRQKEKNFEALLFDVCDLAKEYNFNVWEGRSKNRFSVTLSSFIHKDKQLNISVKLCKDNIYRACFTKEWNPNNNRIGDYTIELIGKGEVINFLTKEIKKFTSKFGMKEKQEFVFTVNPIYHIREE